MLYVWGGLWLALGTGGIVFQYYQKRKSDLNKEDKEKEEKDDKEKDLAKNSI